MAGEVSDNFPDSAGFCVAVADVAAEPAAEEPVFLSADEEHPTVTASTPARIEAEQRNDQE